MSSNMTCYIVLSFIEEKPKCSSSVSKTEHPQWWTSFVELPPAVTWSNCFLYDGIDWEGILLHLFLHIFLCWLKFIGIYLTQLSKDYTEFEVCWGWGHCHTSFFQLICCRLDVVWHHCPTTLTDFSQALALIPHIWFILFICLLNLNLCSNISLYKDRFCFKPTLK